MGFWKKAALIGLGCVLAQVLGFGLAALIEPYWNTLHASLPQFDEPGSSGSKLRTLFAHKDIWGIVEVCIYASLLAPVLEECMFRLWLRKNRTALILGLSFLAFFGLKIFLIPYSASSRWLSVLLLLAAGAALFLVPRFYPKFGFGLKHIDERRRVHGFWIGVSILAFGYMHTTNYHDAAGRILFLSPLFFMNRYVVSVFFTWVRLRYGFWWGVYTHGFNNSVGAVLAGILLDIIISL